MVGLPSTASCRTVGTVAYIMAVATAKVIMATSQTTPKATTIGTTSEGAGSSSALSETTRCRWPLTAEYPIRAVTAMITTAPPYTAAPMPNSCFQ